MPAHYSTGAGSLDIPQPDGLVGTATCQKVSILTPGEAEDKACMPGKRIAQAQIVYVPQLDRPVTPRACQNVTIGGKSQLDDPIRMTWEHTHVLAWLLCLQIP